MYNLYAVKNPETLLIFLLNICGEATFMFDPVLGQDVKIEDNRLYLFLSLFLFLFLISIFFFFYFQT